ncbi:MAG: Crp/Fnr family transcriptional regulator [Casimicrobiaceae bacterium]
MDRMNALGKSTPRTPIAHAACTLPSTLLQTRDSLGDRPLDLPPAAVYEWLQPLGVERRFQAGETLFKAGEPFRALYLLRAGSAKRTLLHPDGREQVLGFALSGDLLGLASLGAPCYQATATALELCLALEIPLERLDLALSEDPRIGELLLSRLGHALRERHGWMVTLGALSAEARVASFLLDLSARFRARGYSGERFVLKMTRAEIGGLLGLTLETVSRVLSRFQQRGLIRLERRELAIVDREALVRVARGADGLAPGRRPH